MLRCFDNSLMALCATATCLMALAVTTSHQAVGHPVLTSSRRASRPMTSSLSISKRGCRRAEVGCVRQTAELDDVPTGIDSRASLVGTATRKQKTEISARDGRRLRQQLLWKSKPDFGRQRRVRRNARESWNGRESWNAAVDANTKARLLFGNEPIADYDDVMKGGASRDPPTWRRERWWCSDNDVIRPQKLHWRATSSEDNETGSRLRPSTTLLSKSVR